MTVFLKSHQKKQIFFVLVKFSGTIILLLHFIPIQIDITPA